jgi:preprotein translocase subunit SecA
LSNKTQSAVFDEVWKQVKERYEEKELRFGSHAMRQFERGVSLMVIDNLWKDHLYEMDHLKGGVQFRAFGQKNPLYEYQREGLQMFEQLRSSIAREITGLVFRLEAVERRERTVAEDAREVHADIDIFSAPARPQEVALPEQTARPLITNRPSQSRPQPVHAGQRVGRNDPCPCGSGKKYKKCHGAL